MAYPDSPDHGEAAVVPRAAPDQWTYPDQRTLSPELPQSCRNILQSPADLSPPPLPLHPPSTHLFSLSHWPFLEDSMSDSPLPPPILGVLFYVSFSAYISQFLSHASVFSIGLLEWQYKVKNAGSVTAKR